MTTAPSLLRAAIAAAVLASANGALAATTSLTIFHNNDGESKLFGDSAFGGLAYFKSTLDGLRLANAGRDQLTLSSGDNFLPGAVFNASLASGPLGSRTYFDALGLAALGYDAITIGNHDFDFGPAVLADFITFYNDNGGTAPFISANLDLSGEAALQTLADSGSILPSIIVERDGNRYGIIGATTTDLPIVTSPGNVVASDPLAAIQAQVDLLEAQGVNKIILSSHLQNLNNELALVSQLRGVDIVIAGGGDELLINMDNVRNSVSEATGPYPLVVQDSQGKNVAVVTTIGEYLYVGQLHVEFDESGDVINVAGEPVVVDKNAVLPDPAVQAGIIDPLNEALSGARNFIIAATEVFLEHNESTPDGPRVIRDRETNLGNLIADAFIWSVAQENSGLTEGNQLIGLTNSGGIRANLDNDVDGQITQGEAEDVLPFANSMAVLGNVSADRLAALLENSVSRLPGNGRFAQISGIQMDYNPDAPFGSRVREIRLEADGTVLWTAQGGSLFDGLFDIATNSFLAIGGDGYDTNGLLITILQTGYSEALIGYLTAGNGLGGLVTAAAYPVEGVGRINVVPLPAAAWLMLGALATLAGVGRQRRRLLAKAE